MGHHKKIISFMLVCKILLCTKSLYVMSQDQQLMHASRNNRVERVKTLISDGADVDATDEYGWTSLMLASRSGHMATVQCLLGAGANPNIVNTFGDCALIEAAKNGKDGVVEALVRHQADIDTPDNRGRTALLHASRYGYIKVAHVLLQAGADLNYVSQSGASALTEAAQIPLLRTNCPTEDTAETQEYTVRLQSQKSSKERLVLDYITRGAPIPQRENMTQQGVPHSMIAFIHQNSHLWRRRRTSSLEGQELPVVLEELIFTIE